MKKAASGATQPPKKTVYIKPTYKNINLANSIKSERNDGSSSGTPATAADSLEYKRGFSQGAQGKKPSPMRQKYEGEGTYERMGRNEAERTMKEKGYTPKKKSGGKIKKANLGGAYKSGGKVTKAKSGGAVNYKSAASSSGHTGSGTLKPEQGSKNVGKCRGGC